MTQDKIIEGNKILAEFMGKKEGMFPCQFNKPIEFITIDQKHSNCFCNCEDYAEMYQNYQYHRDWNWLMLVGGRCLDIVEENDWHEWVNSIVDMAGTFNILLLYNELVLFAKWYKEQKKWKYI
jgi:hypothetical protein